MGSRLTVIHLLASHRNVHNKTCLSAGSPFLFLPFPHSTHNLTAPGVPSFILPVSLVPSLTLSWPQSFFTVASRSRLSFEPDFHLSINHHALQLHSCFGTFCLELSGICPRYHYIIWLCTNFYCCCHRKPKSYFLPPWWHSDCWRPNYYHLVSWRKTQTPINSFWQSGWSVSIPGRQHMATLLTLFWDGGRKLTLIRLRPSLVSIWNYLSCTQLSLLPIAPISNLVRTANW